MMILFILELVALIATFYLLLGSNFTNKPLKIIGACLITCVYCVFILLKSFVIPFTFIYIFILALLFKEKLSFIMSWIVICTLIEMIVGYSFINVVYMITRDIDRNIFSFSPQLDYYLFAFQIALSFLVRKRRNIHAKFLHEIDSKSYWYLFTISLLSICFISFTEAFLYSEIDKSGYYFTALSVMIAIIVILFVTSIVAIILRRYNIKLQHINYLKQKWGNLYDYF